MRVKLTDAQLVMMSAAAQREDHCLTLPETMKGAVVGKVSAKLLKLGLVRETRRQGHRSAGATKRGWGSRSN